MSRYLFVQSQDPFTETRAAGQYELACSLVAAGHSVRLLLIQNGVSVARQGVDCPAFDRLRAGGVLLLADRLSLEQREILGDRLHPDIVAAEIDVVIDAMLAGEKVIWN